MLCSVILLCLFFCSIKASCPEGSIYWDSTCIAYNKTQLSYSKAEDACKKIGGHLISLHDAFESSYIIQKFQYEFSSSDNNFWIGADILTSKGNWKWTDKSSFDFSDWKSGEPKNITGLECAAVSNSDGYWSAENCSEKKPFVCGIAFLPAICESTWLYFEFTKSYYCGFGVFGTTRWGDGENYCNHLGGHLTSIHSQEEASFLNSNFVSKEFQQQVWIGLFSLDNSITWQWTDGTIVDYLFWKYTPDPSENCAMLDSSNFRSTACNNTIGLICKKNKYSTTTKSPATLSTAISMTSITPALADCKWGWEYFDYTKSYYCFSGDGFTSSPTEEFFSWQDGENFCKTLGGHLASVHDKTEFDYFFYRFVGFYSPYWLGLYTLDNGTTWQWSDGSVVDYLPWFPHTPQTNDTKKCVQLIDNLSDDVIYFYSTDCNVTWKAVCKKSAS